MRRFEVLFTSIALIALAGCTSTTDTGNADGALVASTEAVVSTTTAEPSPVAEPSVASVVPPGFESITTADGRIRSYRIVDLSNGEPAPLLFVLHGFGGTAAMMSESSEIDQTFADRYDLHPVVVYPNGTGAESGLP
ncbi:MAG: hypothetical protein ACO3V6_09035, partial [Ilumatobacteraceae bacterium]